MADPLSVLGAGIGVTTLIMQVVDECVKGIAGLGSGNLSR
jgi:hypothetical protein